MKVKKCKVGNKFNVTTFMQPEGGGGVSMQLDLMSESTETENIVKSKSGKSKGQILPN